MLHFDSDYMEGAHPEIMRALAKTNLEQTPGYGTDEYCEGARNLISDALERDDLDIRFLVGGTQTNATVIDALLSRHEGVLAAETGHINVHEAGAIEACGHKVLTLPSHDGKVDAGELSEWINSFYVDDSCEHMVAPGMLYISFPTEYGTLYSREELEALHEVCINSEIPLYIDGARLGYGLASPECDITLEDLPDLCEVFYIGGTKVGALFGECVVAKKGLLRHFTTIVKQHGALLAKGRLLGIQFATLFTDGLYLKISEHADRLARILRRGFEDRGYRAFIDSPTNQQFFELPNEVIDSLMETATFEYWGGRGEESSLVRFVTSWATREEDVQKLIGSLR